MISDRLIPMLQSRFPGQGVVGHGSNAPCMIFPAKHPDVGDVQIYDDGDEVTLIAGNFTHGHFSNHDDISLEKREQEIAEVVADFLDRLFADQVVLWGSQQGIGGWRVVEPGSDRIPKDSEYVWSGPIKIT